MAKFSKAKAERVISDLFASARKDEKFRQKTIKMFSNDPRSALAVLFGVKKEKPSGKVPKLFADSLLSMMKPIGDLSKLLQAIKKPSLQQEIIEVTAIDTLISGMAEFAIMGFETDPPEDCLDALENLVIRDAELAAATAAFTACMAQNATDIEVGAVVPPACSQAHTNFKTALSNRNAALQDVGRLCSPF